MECNVDIQIELQQVTEKVFAIARRIRRSWLATNVVICPLLTSRFALVRCCCAKGR